MGHRGRDDRDRVTSRERGRGRERERKKDHDYREDKHHRGCDKPETGRGKEIKVVIVIEVGTVVVNMSEKGIGTTIASVIAIETRTELGIMISVKLIMTMSKWKKMNINKIVELKEDDD